MIAWRSLTGSMCMKKTEAAFDRVLQTAAIIAMSMIMFAVLAVCVEVTIRYFTGKSLTWVEDVSAMLLVYITFLGAAWLLRIDGHVRVDTVTNRLSPRYQFFFDLFTSVVSAIAFLVIVWYGAEFTLVQFRSGYYMPTPLETPQWVVVVIIPVGCALLLIQLLRKIRDLLKKRGLEAKEDQDIDLSRKLNL